MFGRKRKVLHLCGWSAKVQHASYLQREKLPQKSWLGERKVVVVPKVSCLRTAHQSAAWLGCLVGPFKCSDPKVRPNPKGRKVAWRRAGRVKVDGVAPESGTQPSSM